MNSKKENKKHIFDFGAEFAKGLTPEEAKVESIKIREWWQDDHKTEKSGIKS